VLNSREMPTQHSPATIRLSQGFQLLTTQPSYLSKIEDPHMRYVPKFSYEGQVRHRKNIDGSTINRILSFGLPHKASSMNVI